MDILTDITFSLPRLFLVLPLPLLVIWLMPRASSSQPETIRVPFYAQIQSQQVQQTRQTSRLWLLLAMIIWVLLVTSAARPQSIDEPIQLPVLGRNLMLAVDLSGSMEADDMIIGNRQLTRLSAVKVVAGEFIDRRVGDRLGLILFGDRAYLQAPLTLDRKTVKTLLHESVIGLAGKKTAIGDAIGLAVKRLRKEPEENRVLILLTDGSNTAGSIEPLKAADLAAQEKIRIYTIGVGAESRMMRGVFGINRMVSSDIDIDHRTLHGCPCGLRHRQSSCRHRWSGSSGSGRQRSALHKGNTTGRNQESECQSPFCCNPQTAGDH